MKKEKSLLSEIENEEEKARIEKIKQEMVDSKQEKIVEEPVKEENEEQVQAPKRVHYAEKVFGAMLLSVSVGALPLCIFAWIGAGISAADVGTETAFPTFYLLIPIVMAILGIILLVKK